MKSCDHKFLGSNHCAKCGWPVEAIEAVESLRTALAHAVGQVIELTAEVTQLRARQSPELVMTDADKSKQATEFHWREGATQTLGVDMATGPDKAVVTDRCGSLTCAFGFPWIDHFRKPTGTGIGCPKCQPFSRRRTV